MQTIFLILLFIIGSCFGSFLCCQARRLRLKEQGNKKRLPSRSVCLHCKHQLNWYDNIPILSWLFLRGKCRKCGKKIGIAEFISELGTGIAFVAVFLAFLRSLGSHSPTMFGIFPPQDIASSFWTISPLNIAILIITLILLLPLIFLAIYDGLYGELPTRVLTFTIALAALILILKQITISFANGFTSELIWQPLGAALILGGLYFVLYFVSKGKWVGDGDWLLGLAIGLALANAWLALVTLFVANLLACLYAIPTLKKSRRIHLGPFLVAAFIIVIVFSTPLLEIIK